MAMERPQKDPRGYGLLFVDASRKAGHGSCLSHSCVPTCEVRVAAVNGELCLAMTTLRELEWGEELTFDYNAVTESLNEYRSAVCLCGYGKCRGSFLHFATADIYQQILHRNSPIATRFASLIKGSMKKVMAEDDEKVLRCHGFRTASFGAISVNRKEFAKDEVTIGNGLVDSMKMVPVWLRTYVADTLRYIEYERRALPIALISDNRTTANSEICDSAAQSSSGLAREPKPEPSFFYFSRTQSDLIRSLIEKEGLPNMLSGLQRHHAAQRVAANYWQGLGEEQRQHWKELARADYDKKLKAWRLKRKANDKLTKVNEKQASRESKNELVNNLPLSSITFQDADAEGLSAMEQRIQQLTQTLSRVGRVLYRHREQLFQDDLPQSVREAATDEDLFVKMRDCVHQPIRVMDDSEVITWIWKSSNGILSSLIQYLSKSPCVRKKLLEKVHFIKEKHKHFECIGNNADSDLENMGVLRSQLTECLLELRKAILEDLKEMAAIFKLQKVKKQPPIVEANKSSHTAIDSSPYLTKTDSDCDAPSDSQNEVNVPDSAISEKCSNNELSKNSKESFVNKRSNEFSSGKEESQCSGEDQTSSTFVDEKSDSAAQRRHSDIAAAGDELDWMAHYNERFVLQACADVILLHAHTSNFFVLNPYRALESTPIDVYARELGNTVPRSVIDEDLQRTEKPLSPKAKGVKNKRVANGDGEVNKDKKSKGLARQNESIEFCEPDETVAKVTVKYQGDYVLSQLLQWYNGGIGQKPGIPDLLGCALLPSVFESFASELLSSNRLKAEKKTLYETKVRPRLIEWFQDPHDRGNPWPQEIARAFRANDPSDKNLSVPFGSPVLDFLVTGDETNITLILNELDADDKVVMKANSNGLLSSVDKGQPAQAVSTWVQCEDCMKWRKIPWHVDADMLPEKFYCRNNKWNASANSCEAPEDVWDDSDALVGADGKVEGSPLKKNPFATSNSLSVDDEKNFTMGGKLMFIDSILFFKLSFY